MKRVSMYQTNKASEKLAYKNETVNLDDAPPLDAVNIWLRVLLCPVILPCLFFYALCFGQQESSTTEDEEEKEDDIFDDLHPSIYKRWCSCFKQKEDVLAYENLKYPSMVNLASQKQQLRAAAKANFSAAVDIARTDRLIVPFDGYWVDNILIPKAEFDKSYFDEEGTLRTDGSCDDGNDEEKSMGGNNDNTLLLKDNKEFPLDVTVPDDEIHHSDDDESPPLTQRSSKSDQRNVENPWALPGAFESKELKLLESKEQEVRNFDGAIPGGTDKAAPEVEVVSDRTVGTEAESTESSSKSPKVTKAPPSEPPPQQFDTNGRPLISINKSKVVPITVHGPTIDSLVSASPALREGRAGALGSSAEVSSISPLRQKVRASRRPWEEGSPYDKLVQSTKSSMEMRNRAMSSGLEPMGALETRRRDSGATQGTAGGGDSVAMGDGEEFFDDDASVNTTQLSVVDYLILEYNHPAGRGSSPNRLPRSS